MDYTIITGTSHGIGEALALRLLDPTNTLFCLSRSENALLVETARRREVRLFYYVQDLGELDALDGLLTEIFRFVDPERAHSLSLINNAGMVEPIGAATELHGDQVERHVRVNLLALMRLTSGFLRLSQDLACPKRVVNITSGAARHPYAGWSAYCAAKAGVDMFSRCVGLEQRQMKHPAKVYALAPGLVDTPMQARLREATSDAFYLRDRFVSLKEEGRLATPDEAAKLILRSLTDERIEQGAVVDVREIY